MFLRTSSAPVNSQLLIRLRYLEKSPVSAFHVKILDKQALRSSCELLRQRNMELYVISWNCMQAYVTACKFMELQVRSWNCR